MVSPVSAARLSQRRGGSVGTGAAGRPSDQAGPTCGRLAQANERLRAELEAALQSNEQRCGDALEEERRSAQNASTGLLRAHFLSVMSHEIRTPLSAIIGYTDLLGFELAATLTDRQRAHLEHIHACSDHLLRLLDDFLDLERAEVGRLPVARERYRIHESVEGALGMTEPQARSHEITLLNAAQDCADVEYVGDETRVQQILGNLLSNAVKFSHPGGTVRVSCSSAVGCPPNEHIAGDRAWTCVHVDDDGIGIPESEQRAVFEPFVQGAGARLRNARGAGLGLAISRELARAMGGDLTLRSGEGTGSRFTLWLPSGASQTAAD